MRIAVVGLGFMGMMHVKAIRNSSLAKLAAVVSDDETKLSGDLSSIAGNLGGPGERMDFTEVRKYKNAEACFADPDVDAVDLCVPTHLHEPLAVAALRAGKHVLVEKPMALDADACARMIEEAEHAGRVLMTAQVLRFFPSYVVLRDHLPRIARVRTAVFRRRCAGPAWAKWLSDKTKSGGGVFDLLIHDVDQCIALFGAPEALSAVGFEDLPRGIDTIEANFYYPNGLVAAIGGGWHHPKSFPFSMEYTVTGDNGAIDYSSAGRPPTLYSYDGGLEVLPEPAIDGYQAEIEYFLLSAAAGKAPERCKPRDSALAVRLTRLMDEARTKNGEKIPCRF